MNGYFMIDVKYNTSGVNIYDNRILLMTYDNRDKNQIFNITYFDADRRLRRRQFTDLIL